MKKRKKSDGAGLEARCRCIVRDLACLTTELCLLLKYKYSQRHSGCRFYAYKRYLLPCSECEDETCI